jgi:excisionase family DNA binding protein
MRRNVRRRYPLRIGLREAAEILGLGTQSVRRMISRGQLPATRIGGHTIRVLRSDVEKLLVPVND